MRRYACALPRALKGGHIFGRRPRRAERDPDGYLESWIPYEEHVRELAVLKLAGRAYSPEDYRAALERYIQAEIRIKTVPELLRASSAATVAYDPDTGDVTVWVPERLVWWLRRYAIFHELAHVAAAHPAMERRPSDGVIVGTSPAPVRRLARKQPPTTGNTPDDLPEPFAADLDRFYEDEADLRAQHHMVTGSLGARALEFDRLSQLR